MCHAALPALWSTTHLRQGNRLLKLLAIETATEACSAALSIEGEILSRFEVAPQRHGELILPMCDALINEAGIELSQLDAIAFGRGPGSFTGVRIATGVVQGIAFAKDLPVIPISTLALLAQAAIDTTQKKNILPAIDARMNEVYWGGYTRDENGLAKRLGEERVLRTERIPMPSGSGWFGVGSAWKTYAKVLTEKLGDRLIGYNGDLLPHARFLVPLAADAFKKDKTVSAEQALPVYLRDKVAEKPR